MSQGQSQSQFLWTELVSDVGEKFLAIPWVKTKDLAVFQVKAKTQCLEVGVGERGVRVRVHMCVMSG